MDNSINWRSHQLFSVFFLAFNNSLLSLKDNQTVVDNHQRSFFSCVLGNRDIMNSTRLRVIKIFQVAMTSFKSLSKALTSNFQLNLSFFKSLSSVARVQVVCLFIFSWTTRKIIKIQLDHNSCEMQFQQFFSFFRFLCLLSPFEMARLPTQKACAWLWRLLITSHEKGSCFCYDLWWQVSINKQLLISLFSQLWLKSHLENWITCCFITTGF